jgi:hypothetical protein
MGLGVQLAELIIREHCYRPLPPIVHTLGRLKTGFDYVGAAELIRRCGAEPVPVDAEVDTFTLEGRRDGAGTITDTTFFRMLGVEEVHAIDINDYERRADCLGPLQADPRPHGRRSRVYRRRQHARQCL